MKFPINYRWEISGLADICLLVLLNESEVCGLGLGKTRKAQQGATFQEVSLSGADPTLA